ncbi:MAG: hypothetical protein IPP25_13060 [Saprospiraceae bacterium]|nr:hypothetical protein [Candidatus Opimibacter skivensis]
MAFSPPTTGIPTGILTRMPLQERRGERSRTICSCNHRDTYRNTYGESILESSWSQEQTPATAEPFFIFAPSNETTTLFFNHQTIPS